MSHVDDKEGEKEDGIQGLKSEAFDGKKTQEKNPSRTYQES